MAWGGDRRGEVWAWEGRSGVREQGLQPPSVSPAPWPSEPLRPCRLSSREGHPPKAGQRPSPRACGNHLRAE